MRYLFCSVLLLGLIACNEKKSDIDLFNEGKTRVTLSADPTSGYEPLDVAFEAYLENKERVLTKNITEAKWVIKGPNGYFREVAQESTNYQYEEENEADSFYLDFNFPRYGRYTVKLVLNDGEYISNPSVIRVQERETENSYKPRY